MPQRVMCVLQNVKISLSDVVPSREFLVSKKQKAKLSFIQQYIVGTGVPLYTNTISEIATKL